MAIHKNSKMKQKPRSSILIFTVLIAAIGLLYLLSSLTSTNGFSSSPPKNPQNLVGKAKNHPRPYSTSEKYLYWGNRIDCPGKHCESCEGLGHQESSLRCALEEAMFLHRTFVMPSRMCINPIHNKKGILHQSDNATSEARWAASSCAMDSLYDLDLMSNTVTVILDDSETWHQTLSTSMKLGSRGIAHVHGVSRAELKEKSQFTNILLINRTASPLSWFMECKDRNNRSAIMLPYSFLPSMASKKLRDTAEKIHRLNPALVITMLFMFVEVIN
ncbi:Nuclear transition protein like [Actinidia chinensis var. chinensis]|uniref:Nuclear transition protein like n=1 Tax=Actinidia chinensis var. chinensis TaxID=1590841 RepID=A0A2R6QVF9_ACTCC|nr:Nuclear transition protein like [Actinidia chinensis var. chinensis]